MLSDFPKHEVTQAYGTYRPELGTSRRITYVVDKQGIVRAEIVSDDNMTRHAERALAVVQKLEGIEP